MALSLTLPTLLRPLFCGPFMQSPLSVSKFTNCSNEYSDSEIQYLSVNAVTTAIKHRIYYQRCRNEKTRLVAGYKFLSIAAGVASRA